MPITKLADREANSKMDEKVKHKYVEIDNGVEILLIFNQKLQEPVFSDHHNSDPEKECLNQAHIESTIVEEAWLWDEGVLELPVKHRFVEQAAQKVLECH